ncbi:MAG: M23 family metallopeptidase, partial [Treponema sp.]|nr:M23 family metallopeptidase [Treponema sp.]
MSVIGAKRTTVAAVFALTIFSISVSDTLNAMSWPSEDAVLVSNFGSNNNGLPVLGMIFSGGTDILAAEEGEVIFSRAKNDAASRLPSPLGAWTAVDHGDGLISIYSRYAPASEGSADESGSPAPSTAVSGARVEKFQPIASSGISGWSARNGFYFTIFDRRDRHWINPAMIVTPVQNTRPPQILSVNLRNAQGQIQSSYIIQGR